MTSFPSIAHKRPVFLEVAATRQSSLEPSAPSSPPLQKQSTPKGFDYSRFDNINSDSEDEADWKPLADAWTSPDHEKAYKFHVDSR